MNSYKLILVLIAALLLLFAISFAAKGKKEVTPSNATPVTIKQQEAQPTPPSPTSPATGEQINWQVISSGGTKGTSTNFVLDGTVGQAVVGEGSSASYGLSHGFWQEFVTIPNECIIRGDVDHSGSIDVGDLTYLVAYLFQSGPAPPCPEEGDVDGSGSIDVGDLTYLVAYLFQGGPAPPPC